jgi:ribose transport system permease protein
MSADTMNQDEPTPTPAQRSQVLWQATRRFRPILGLDILLLIVFSIAQSGFLTSVNLQNILTSEAVLWVIAMGMTFVLLSGGFDLSVAAVASLAGIFFAKLAGGSIPGGLVLALTVAFGFVVGGLVNGTLIGRLGLNVFVVTLASLTALTGVVSLWTNVQSIYVTAPILQQIAINSILGVPTLIWIMGLTFLLALYVQTRTYFGRDVYAIGGSLTAARLSGMRTSLVLFTVYAISGACAALGGVISAGRIGAATPQVDATLPLQAIAAVLIGGTSLTGGAGGVTGTAIGVLFIGILDNGLSLAGISSFWQEVITGLILVAAVMGDKVHFALRPRRDETQSATSGAAS